MKTKLNSQIILFAVLLILGEALTLIFCACFINVPQKFTDIVPTAMYTFTYNITIEKNLLSILLFSGSFIILIYYILKKKSSNHAPQPLSSETLFLVMIIVGVATSFIAYRHNRQLMILPLLFLLFIIDRKLIPSGVCSFILASYALIGLYRLAVILGFPMQLSNSYVSVAALILSAIPLCFKDKKLAYYRFSAICNFFTPLTLLVFLQNKYIWKNELYVYSVPMPLLLTILLFLVIFELEAIKLIRNKKSSFLDFEGITLGSCISIINCNRFDGTGVIMPADIHHPFENIIGFQQIFELGQKSFLEYTPISGEYSFVHGFVHFLWGDGGKFSNYHATRNLFFLFIIVILILLLKNITERSFLLLISLFFYMPSYNRYALILPIMVLLIQPKLRQNHRLWLIAYSLTSVLHALYYPAFGVAIAFAFLPFAIWLLTDYVKSGIFKAELKTWPFYVSVIPCAILLCIMIRPVLGTALHTLVYSKASTVSEGLARFGSSPPTWFFPLLSGLPILKLCLWHGLTFLLPAAFVWLSVMLLMEQGNMTIKTKRLIVNNWKEFLLQLSFVIAPIISFTFSTLTKHSKSIFSRSLGMLIAEAIILLVYYCKKASKATILLTCILCASALCLYTADNTEPIDSSRATITLSPCYYVPDTFTRVDDQEIQLLGKGFCDSAMYENIVTASKQYQPLINNNLMNVPGQYGYFYLMGASGTGTIELTEAKGYERAKEAYDAAQKTNSVIALPSRSYEIYYFYKKVLTSGDYVYQPENGTFFPADGTLTNAEIKNQNKQYHFIDGATAKIIDPPKETDLNALSAAWGASFDSLKGLFEQPSIEYQLTQNDHSINITFPEGLEGETADFLYLEFDDSNFTELLTSTEAGALSKYFFRAIKNPNQLVHLSYADDDGEEYSISCQLLSGKLLIPLGGGTHWLLHCHASISLQLTDADTNLALPKIEKLEFLQLRDL